MNAKRRATPQSLLARAPAWVAVRAGGHRTGRRAGARLAPDLHAALAGPRRGERVIVVLPDRSGSHLERGDQVEVWRYDGKPLALVAAGGERFDVGLMGGTGLVALVAGAGLLALLAVAGAAHLLARVGSRSMLGGGLQTTAMTIGIPFSAALVISLLVDRAD